MPIHFNSPEHIKERQEVKPLTLEETENAIGLINSLIRHASFNPFDIEIENLQNMVYEYENLKHAYISSRNVTEDIEVIYTVESKNNKDE